MKYAGGQPIESTEIEYGVKFNNGITYVGEDREDAEFIAGLWGEGDLVTRAVHVTPWEVVAE